MLRIARFLMWPPHLARPAELTRPPDRGRAAQIKILTPCNDRFTESKLLGEKTA